MHSLPPSPRTLKYIAALNREGDNFDYWAWLKRVEEEEAREKAVAQAPLARSLQDVHPKSGPFATASQRSTGTLIKQPDERVSPLRNNSIRSRLSKVSDAWDNFQESRRRDAVFDYFRSVFSIVWHYRERNKIQKLLRRACKYSRMSFDNGAEPFAVIIRCTCGNDIDAKTVSKWSSALRYAAYRKTTPRYLKQFMKRIGGINACAAQFADLRRRGKAVD